MCKLTIFLVGVMVGEILIIVTDKIINIRAEKEIEKAMKEVLKEKEEEVEIL